MTPKEKAIDLFFRYETTEFKKCKDDFCKVNMKQCALTLVNEIINLDTFFKTLQDSKEFTKYWYEVQDEINKL